MADEITPNKEVVNNTVDNSSPLSNESTIFGISIRGLLALFLILTVCAMSLLGKTVSEPLYTLVMVISSFYFGHQVGKSSK